MKEQETRKKRYYNKGDKVWAMSLKSEVEVVSVDTENYNITVLHTDEQGNKQEHMLPLWGVDVLKYKAREKYDSKPHIRGTNISYGNLCKVDCCASKQVEVKMAKVRPNAIIPSKRKEDAGYDIYAGLEIKDGFVNASYMCPKGEVTLVPTGIAMALPDTHYFNAKHERGSTGKIGLAVLAGVVDSGYRGELFIAVSPMVKDVVISTAVTEISEHDTVIYYPTTKAIAQGTIELVPDVKIEEVSYEELLSIESERGVTKLGQSGK
ncbi:MAG: hypothetical protein ACRC4N_15755 [Gammaproteobacteria bacterium]